MTADLGYYSANGKKFTNKIQAILEAQTNLSDVTWDFHCDTFNRINWQEEPSLSLDALYKIRAQQIRNDYDYVIIMCSGGADSTNVVKTFLNNNIHIDEIIGSAPMSGLNNWNWNDKDTSVSNTISETKYALFPLLNEIATSFPNIKITINDYFEDITKYQTDKWLYECLDWVNPVINAKGDLNKFKHLKDLAEQGKRIAIVWGIDKPIIRYNNDGSLCTLITDLGVNNAVQPFDKDYPNVSRVIFYWGPELPEMLVKQSHAVAKFIHKKENLWLTDLVKQMGGVKLWHEDRIQEAGTVKGDYQRSIVPAIYPTTYDNVFQCQKSAISFLSPQHDWFNILHKGTHIHQMVESDFKLFYKNIHPKYLGLNKNSFITFRQRYNIGHYTKFMEFTT